VATPSVILCPRAEVIVMSTGGHSRLAAALLGSVTEKVVRLSPIPVLTVNPRSAS